VQEIERVLGKFVKHIWKDKFPREVGRVGGPIMDIKVAETLECTIR